MNKYYTVEDSSFHGAKRIKTYDSHNDKDGHFVVNNDKVEGFCDCLEMFGYERKEIEKSVDITFKAKGYVYENTKCIGITLDNGFTLQMQDKDGNVIPLNKEAIESFVKEKTDE